MSVAFAKVAAVILTDPQVIMSVINSMKKLANTVKPFTEALDPLTKEMYTPAAIQFEQLLNSENFRLIVEKQNNLLALINTDPVQKGLDNLGEFINAINRYLGSERSIQFTYGAIKFIGVFIHVLAEVLKLVSMNVGEIIDWCSGEGLHAGGGEWDLDGNFYDMEYGEGYFGYIFHKYATYLEYYKPLFDWEFWNPIQTSYISTTDHRFLLASAPPGAEENFDSFMEAYMQDPSLVGFAMPSEPAAFVAVPNMTQQDLNIYVGDLLNQLRDAAQEFLAKWRTW